MNEQMTPSPQKKIKIWIKKAIKPILWLLLLWCVLNMIGPIREAIWEARVVSYCLLHQGKLNEFVEEFPFEEYEETRKHIDYKGWEVSCFPVHEEGTYKPGSYDIPDRDPYVIQFHRFGFGLVPASTYAGMYYSSDDTPSGFQGVPMGSRGDTKKICDHWYWYIAWF